MVLRVVPSGPPGVNSYCTNCLQTRKFQDMGTFLACEYCRKRLEKVSPEVVVKR